MTILSIFHITYQKNTPRCLLQTEQLFAPFAALTGYGEQIKETARTTEEFHQVSGREKEEIDQKLQILLQTQYKHPLISTYYFTPDARKQGGHYEKKTEYVKRIDPVKEYIIMKDDTIIRFHYIKELQGEIFNKVIVG